MDVIAKGDSQQGTYNGNPLVNAMTVGIDFYTEAVQLAKKLDLIILSDLAYAEIYFNNEPPPSVLQVPGAIDITVEFTSLSKTYAMPGWRMGFAVGNERLIAALTRVKSYLDYGAFTPIQAAASGKVVFADVHPEYGRMVEIDHGNGLISRYAHASQLLVRQGDLVVAGQKIATVGATGRSTGPHLHFEVRLNGVPQNPARFLKSAG